MIDDADEITPSSTPAPPEEKELQEKDGISSSKESEKAADVDDPESQSKENGEKTGSGKEPGEQAQPPALADAAPAELPTEVKAKLRKLEKLEKTYPGAHACLTPSAVWTLTSLRCTELLRSCRIAHGRATSIEPFEKALRENTPPTTIKDPDAMVEYLNQLNLKGDMVMDEFKRVSAEKDTFKKKSEDVEKELAALKEEVASLKAAQAAAAGAVQG